MFDIQTTDANRDWIAHYAAVKARIARKERPPVVQLNHYDEPIGPVISCATKSILAARARYAKLRPTTHSIAQKILLETCVEFDISMNDLLSPRRFQDAVRARRKAYWRLKSETKWSLPQIGRFVNKDHTTVLHGIRRFELDALHQRNGFPIPSNREFLIYEKLGCRASAYLAAREGLQ